FSLAGRAATNITAPVQFDTSGSHVLTAQLSGGGYQSDDQAELAVDVLEPVKVLIIGAGSNANAADFLSLALAPYHANDEQGIDPATVLSKSYDQELATQRPDVIILNDLPILSAQKV